MDDRSPLEARLNNPPNDPLNESFDILIVGAGAAGLYSALCLPSTFRIGLISKDKLSRSASGWAQGGIAAVVDSDDSTELHLQDTLRAGAGICDEAAVRFLVETAPDCIQHLVDLGVAFDRTHQDKLALTLEAAHSRRRVLHAADTTGRAVVTTLTQHVLSQSNIEILSPAFVLDLWIEDGVTQGVRLLYDGQIRKVAARSVVLATGGGGQVFAQTTNPKVSTGDGVAIAHRAGAVLRDLEFIQFHPTALTQVDAPRFLISEAVRGEGAHLIDDAGHRFVFDYHPDGELAPRDIVSRAIFSHLQTRSTDSGTHSITNNVWLDLRPIPAEKIRQRFPNIIQVCQTWGIDVFTMPIPVAPAAHYWMGGIQTNLDNHTTIPGLYAVGETASTGVHGANRLASNSLLECIVYGAQLGKMKIPEAPRPPTLGEKEIDLDVQTTDPDWIAQMRSTLARLVWQSAGISRERATLDAAIAQVQHYQRDFTLAPLSYQLALSLDYQVKPEDEPIVRAWGELHNLLDVAELILRSAQKRTESRGGHYRSDYPTIDEAWEVHTLVQNHTWTTSAIG
ncbi:MAG: L-aspartate oxidase [Alkalinema sp. FL-bin-369]|nr:L-aspartate oxidase [Leptolyngbyaceae cyanobacterium LF-bin-369]